MRSQLRHACAAQLAGRIFRGVPGARRVHRSTVRAGLGIGVRAWFVAAADSQVLSPRAAFDLSMELVANQAVSPGLMVLT